MRVIPIIILVLMSYSSGFCAEIKNADEPLKGSWDFKLNRQWTVKEAGNDIFTIIDDLKCSKTGILYVMDRKLCKIFPAKVSTFILQKLKSRKGIPSKTFI